MQLQVSISGDKQVQALLKRTAGGVVNLKEPLTNAAKYLTNYYSGVAFLSRGSVFGERWPKLNPAYERRKLKKYGSRPMLVATGLMQRSFKYRAEPTMATIYNSTDYFKYHQTGGRHLPRRAMMGVNDTIQNDVQQIMNKYIGALIARDKL